MVVIDVRTRATHDFLLLHTLKKLTPKLKTNFRLFMFVSIEKQTQTKYGELGMEMVAHQLQVPKQNMFGV